jgi:hypothetical protein
LPGVPLFVSRRKIEYKHDIEIYPHKEGVSQGLPIPKGWVQLFFGGWSFKNMGSENTEKLQPEGRRLELCPRD